MEVGDRSVGRVSEKRGMGLCASLSMCRSALDWSQVHWLAESSNLNSIASYGLSLTYIYIYVNMYITDILIGKNKK
jgi:hypothetical protein